MKTVNVIVLLFVILAVACKPRPHTPAERASNAITQLQNATNELQRFHALCKAAKESFNAAQYASAEDYANDVLRLAAKFPDDWNYGNAIHDGNLVLGRLVLRSGRTEDAKKYLLASGRTPGSPTLNSFGPNMALAKDLLLKGESDAVIEYLELCRKFWISDHGNIDRWESDIRIKRMPQFGANLSY